MTILTTYQWLYNQLQTAKFSIKRLKNLFGIKTEKNPAKTSLGIDVIQAAENDNTAEKIGLCDQVPNNDEPAAKKIVAPVWNFGENHGRNGAAQYTGCPKIFFQHTTLKIGDCCPSCASVNLGGKLSLDKPQVVVRLEGGALITGNRYVVEILRCNLCDERYKTDLPPEIKNSPKYDVSCASAIAIGRYSFGLPLSRIETNQAMQGIPLADATQWDILKNLYNTVSPVYEIMQKDSANGELMIYDDTPNRILAEQACGKTTRTTAYISVHDSNIIHLFFTGQKHAGNNADLILAQRTSDEPVIAMMDASQNNIPKYMSATLTALDSS